MKIEINCSKMMFRENVSKFEEPEIKLLSIEDGGKYHSFYVDVKMGLSSICKSIDFIFCSTVAVSKGSETTVIEQCQV